MVKWSFLLVGSMVGGVSRFLLTGFVHRFVVPNFPYGTLVVNLSGCFLIGFFEQLANNKFLFGPDSRLLLMTGFCGAFTTFSTFIFETARMVKEGDTGLASVNVVISILLGYALFRLGELVGQIF